MKCYDILVAAARKIGQLKLKKLLVIAVEKGIDTNHIYIC